MRNVGLSFFFTILFVLIIPGFITFFFGAGGGYGMTEPITGVRDEQAAPEAGDDADYTSPIPVFNPETEYRIGIEDYIRGVVAAEMPAEYELEALKAQAVAARTYAYKRIGGKKDSLSAEDIANIDQAYLSDGELMSIWGSEYERYDSKIRTAVDATKGQIMVYGGEPIEAVFHSTSAGKTVDAENVWDKEYPYLKSVESAEDELVSEKRFDRQELLLLCKQKFGVDLSDGSFTGQFQILSATDAGYVLEARLGGEILSGRQLREALGLKSAAFTVSEENGMIVFITKGYGHGVGMSQRGANAMAVSGCNYIDILKHYYKDIELESLFSAPSPAF